MNYSQIVDLWHLRCCIEVQREVGGFRLVPLIDNCESVDASWELLGPPSHCSETFVRYPFVLLFINRLVLGVFEVKDDIIVWIALSSWIVAIGECFGRDIEILLNWVINLKFVLPLASE